LVADVQANRPAERAGLNAGDVIISVNGEALDDARSLARRIVSMAPGTSVRLAVIRNGQEESRTVTLGELPPERQASRIDECGMAGWRANRLVQPQSQGHS